jgi:hypothetical protein
MSEFSKGNRERIKDLAEVGNWTGVNSEFKASEVHCRNVPDDKSCKTYSTAREWPWEQDAFCRLLSEAEGEPDGPLAYVFKAGRGNPWTQGSPVTHMAHYAGGKVRHMKEGKLKHRRCWEEWGFAALNITRSPKIVMLPPWV